MFQKRGWRFFPFGSSIVGIPNKCAGVASEMFRDKSPLSYVRPRATYYFHRLRARSRYSRTHAVGSRRWFIAADARIISSSEPARTSRPLIYGPCVLNDCHCRANTTAAAAAGIDEIVRRKSVFKNFQHRVFFSKVRKTIWQVRSRTRNTRKTGTI